MKSCQPIRTVMSKEVASCIEDARSQSPGPQQRGRPASSRSEQESYIEDKYRLLAAEKNFLVGKFSVQTQNLVGVSNIANSFFGQNLVVSDLREVSG